MDKCACIRTTVNIQTKKLVIILSLNLSLGVKCLGYSGGLSLIAVAQGYCGCSPGRV